MAQRCCGRAPLFLNRMPSPLDWTAQLITRRRCPPAGYEAGGLVPFRVPTAMVSSFASDECYPEIYCDSEGAAGALDAAQQSAGRLPRLVFPGL
jgi:hypothetical protein